MDCAADFEYHHKRWILAGYPEVNSLDRSEAKRAKENHRVAVLQVATEMGALARAVSQARIAFRRSTELEWLVAAVVDNYASPVADTPNTSDRSTRDGLNAWIVKTKGKHGMIVSTLYGHPIRMLLTSLRDHVDDPV